MKTLLFVLLLAQTDPWQPYASNGWGSGGKPKPIVSEPATYTQVAMLLSAGALVYFIQRKRNKNL